MAKIKNYTNVTDQFTEGEKEEVKIERTLLEGTYKFADLIKAADFLSRTESGNDEKTTLTLAENSVVIMPDGQPLVIGRDKKIQGQGPPFKIQTSYPVIGRRKLYIKGLPAKQMEYLRDEYDITPQEDDEGGSDDIMLHKRGGGAINKFINKINGSKTVQKRKKKNEEEEGATENSTEYYAPYGIKKRWGSYVLMAVGSGLMTGGLLISSITPVGAYVAVTVVVASASIGAIMAIASLAYWVHKQPGGLKKIIGGGALFLLGAAAVILLPLSIFGLAGGGATVLITAVVLTSVVLIATAIAGICLYFKWGKKINVADSVDKTTNLHKDKEGPSQNKAQEVNTSGDINTKTKLDDIEQQNKECHKKIKDLQDQMKALHDQVTNPNNQDSKTQPPPQYYHPGYAVPVPPVPAAPPGYAVPAPPPGYAVPVPPPGYPAGEGHACSNNNGLTRDFMKRILAEQTIELLTKRVGCLCSGRPPFYSDINSDPQAGYNYSRLNPGEQNDNDNNRRELIGISQLIRNGKCKSQGTAFGPNNPESGKVNQKL